MIKTFACKETQKVFGRVCVSCFPCAMQRVALRKLWMLHAAVDIRDLRVPPGNRLEQLKGARAGWWSIRVNDQWRICFRWECGHAHDVAIIDYH